jgi:endonuclease/exonuclease/phosphatase family metal-dependent hydrolase
MRTKTLLLVVIAAGLCGCAPRSSLLIAPELVSSCAASSVLSRPLVVANYNIKSAMLSSVEEVGDVLAGMDADVIALQEVDHLMKRTDGVDQSLALAERLGMKRVFAGAMDRDDGTYGIALLSRLPLASVKRFELPMAGGFEPRVAIDAEVCASGKALRFVTTHSDFTPWAAEAHARAITEYVGSDDDVIILGDFNATPDTAAVRDLIARPLFDALGLFAEGPTFPQNKSRIDYILTDRRVLSADIVEVDASDHFPVLAAIEAPGADQLAAATTP